MHLQEHERERSIDVQEKTPHVDLFFVVSIHEASERFVKTHAYCA